MFSKYALALSLMAFFATSVDDFCVLLIFFSREYAKTNDLSNPDTQRAFTNICIGQFVGFTIIVSVSLAIGIGLSQTVDDDWIDLIGFIPILIGCYLIYELMSEAGYFECCCPSGRNKNIDYDDDIENGSDVPDQEKLPLVSTQSKPPGILSTHTSSIGTASDPTPETQPKPHGILSTPQSKKDRKNIRLQQEGHSIDSEAKRRASFVIHADDDDDDTKDKRDSNMPSKVKHVSIDERRHDEESKEGGNAEGIAGGGGSYHNDGQDYQDESDEEEKPVKKTKPKRKRTLSADLSGRYFESLNDRIDVSHAVGEAIADSQTGKGSAGRWVNCCLDPLSQEVITYVLIFGIDNLAIFTVLFANVSEIETVVVVVVFYLMLFFYIALTIAILVTCPAVGHWFGNNVRYLVPFVLIGFGVYILYGSVIWQPNLE